MADRAELVGTILARTREGKLDWEELSQTGFVARVGQTMIIVDRARGDQQPYIRITDDSGKVLEIIRDPVASGVALSGTTNLISELYELTRKQALGVEEALSNLKRNLDKL